MVEDRNGRSRSVVVENMAEIDVISVRSRVVCRA